MTAWKYLRITMIATLALGLVACGDDDGGTDAGGDAGTDSMMPDDGGETNSIVDIAAGNPDFSILVEAATRAGLVETLSEIGGQTFTVFAPTDQAFADSGITSLDDFTDEELTGILSYHALLGTVMSTDISAGPADTVAGLTLFLGTEGGVTVNGGNAITGGANVVMADIEADNGVIHVIDRVLLPPNIPMAATYGGLTELLGAVGAASPLGDGTTVAEALSGEGPFTVFAPTNAAFEALEATPDADTLRDVLLYHVVGAGVPSSEVPAAADSLLQNEWGNGVTLLFDTSSGVAVNGAAVAIADINTTNGVVHVIDAVLLPPNVVDMVGIAGLSSLGDAVGAAAALGDGTSVADALAAQTAYTVFAPTNDAFPRRRVPDRIETNGKAEKRDDNTGRFEPIVQIVFLADDRIVADREQKHRRQDQRDVTPPPEQEIALPKELFTKNHCRPLPSRWRGTDGGLQLCHHWARHLDAACPEPHRKPAETISGPAMHSGAAARTRASVIVARHRPACGPMAALPFGSSINPFGSDRKPVGHAYVTDRSSDSIESISAW